MKSFTFDTFDGMDTRAGTFGDNRRSLVSATNLSVLTGGAIRRRPGMRKIVDLHSESCGLYARGGLLHTVVPGGRSIQDLRPAEVIYDPIGQGAQYPLGALSRLVAADTYGTDTVFGPHGYVAVERTDGIVEHHWIQTPPTLSSASVSTRVGLPFAPGDSLVKLEQHIWTPAQAEGTVRFSSVLSPDNWTETGDAGFLPVLSHLSGARDILTLNHYRGRLAVFFADAVQLWRVDADPELTQLEQVLNGPGATLAGAVANVLGDVMYLSRGGFRTLSTATVTGEANEADIGGRIKSLTDAIGTGTPAVSLWSQSRSQFICCIGTTAYVLTHIPSERLTAWTTWTLPTAIDYLVELDGVLYARSGVGLYQFVDGDATDYSAGAVTSTFETRQLSLGQPGLRKSLHWITIQQTTAAAWTMIVDGTAMRTINVPACSPKPLRIPVNGEARQVAFRATSTSVDWRLEGLSVEYEAQGV